MNNYFCRSKNSSTYKVDPIKNTGEILAIKRLLRNSPRDLLLFTIGINTWLCISDLLNIKIADIKDLTPAQGLIVRPDKHGEQGTLIINQTIYQALQMYLRHLSGGGERNDQEYLFASRKGGKPLTVSTINNMVKSWTKSVGMEGNYGGQSLRKTWGYHHWVANSTDYYCISRKFNHGTESITKRYLGIESNHANFMQYLEIGAGNAIPECYTLPRMSEAGHSAAA